MIMNSLEGIIATKKRQNKEYAMAYVVYVIANMITYELRGFFVPIIPIEEKKEFMQSHITKHTIAYFPKKPQNRNVLH